MKNTTASKTKNTVPVIIIFIDVPLAILFKKIVIQDVAFSNMTKIPAETPSLTGYINSADNS